LLRIVNKARAHRSPREALDLIRDLNAQAVEPRQIASNLNMLKIRAFKQDPWTEESVNAVLTWLRAGR